MFLGLAVLSVAFVVSSAQSAYPVFGGETFVAENNPDVQEAKGLVFQELREQARHLPGSPSVDITDLKVKQQVVAGFLYNMSFRAVYTYSAGRRVIQIVASWQLVSAQHGAIVKPYKDSSHFILKVTKSCTAKVISPINSDKLTFVDPDDKIRCI